MMRSLLCLLYVSCCLVVSGQQYMDTNDPREIKSLLSRDNDLSGFGGGDVKITDFSKERAMVLGAYGGVLVNRRYMLGLGGYGIATNPEITGVLPPGFSSDNEQRDLTINGGYAGLIIGGIVFSKELVHLTIPVLLGAGEFQVSDEDFFQNNSHTDYTIERSPFLVAEPGAQLEFNITNTFRIAAGASYRYVYGLELVNLTDADMTEWTGTLSLRFGRF